MIALHAEPQSLDPHLQGDAASTSVLANVYESLTTFDADLRIQPQLARSWSNPEDLVWDLELQPDVLFHDGRPVRAEDVVASLERAQTLPGSRAANYLNLVTKVRVLGPLRVEIRTSEPDPLLLARLASVFVLPAGVTDPVAEPVGSGRYRLIDATEGAVALEGFRDHRLGPPPLTNVRFEFVPSAAERVVHLLERRADLVSRLVAEEATALLSDDSVELIQRPGLQVSFLQLHKDIPPFDDPKVRRAIDLAIDRRALAQRSHGEPRGQLVGPNVFGFNPELRPDPPDPEGAGRLLAEAGFADGLVLEIALGRGIDMDRLVEQLSTVGIEASLEHLPFPTLLERLGRGEQGAAYLSCLSGTGDALDLLESLAHSPTADGRFGDSNWTGLADPELDTLIEEAGQHLDPSARMALVQEALAVLDSHWVIIPLISASDVYGVRSDITFSPRLDGRILAAEVARR